MNVSYDHLYKILLVGDSNVGKSSLLFRFVDDSFNELYDSTIGVDFKIKTIEIDNKTIKLQLWDSAGQERFRTITKSFYRNSHGIIVVYDITKRKSFENLNYWLEEIKLGNKTANIVILGNKCDLNKDRQIDFETAKQYAASKNIKFMETSALKTINVNESFFALVSEIIENQNVISVPSVKLSSLSNKRCC